MFVKEKQMSKNTLELLIAALRVKDKKKVLGYLKQAFEELGALITELEADDA